VKKIIAIFIAITICSILAVAQSDRGKAELAIGGGKASVDYGRPAIKGRTIEALPVGSEWRMGANDATEIEFYKNVQINGDKVAKGRYTLYAIPNADNWTFILNKDVDTWGAFKYDAQKDVLRTTVPIEKLNDVVEALSMNFEKTDNGCNLVVAWDNVKADLPISIK